MSTILWIVVSVLTIIPMMKLLPHFGINQNWAFACILPFAPLILIWIMATKLQEMEKR